MARPRGKETRPRRCNRSDTSDSEAEERRASRGRKQTKKVTKNSRCQSRSEAPPRRKRTRSPQNLSDSNSVVLLSEIPCCANEEERSKYARLGLDGALFLSNSRPAKRRQSHVSIIEISSSDEDTGIERTAEWAALAAFSDLNDILCEGDTVMVDTIIEPNNSQELTCSTGTSTSPESTVRPFHFSTPGTTPLPSSTVGEKLIELSQKLVETTFSHPSNITNQSNIFSSMMAPRTPRLFSAGPSSSINVHSQMRSSQQFYCGPFQTTDEIPSSPLNISTNVFSLRPMTSDLTISDQLPRLSVMDGSQRQATQPTPRRQLWQIASTSHSPVSDPQFETESPDMESPDE